MGGRRSSRPRRSSTTTSSPSTIPGSISTSPKRACRIVRASCPATGRSPLSCIGGKRSGRRRGSCSARASSGSCTSPTAASGTWLRSGATGSRATALPISPSGLLADADFRQNGIRRRLKNALTFCLRRVGVVVRVGRRAIDELQVPVGDPAPWPSSARRGRPERSSRRARPSIGSAALRQHSTRRWVHVPITVCACWRTPRHRPPRRSSSALGW